MKNAKFLVLTMTAVFAFSFGMTSCTKDNKPVPSPVVTATPKPTATATPVPTPVVTPTVIPTVMPELIPTEMPENPTAVPTQTINPTAHK